MLSRLASSISYRAKWASMGVLYLRRLQFDSVHIAGRRVSLSFPQSERALQEQEFGHVVFDDCYRLASIKAPVKTVLDIGANIGLFAIAARRHFPEATIHCYEPNSACEPHLKHHCNAVDASAHMTAVGLQNGAASLSFNAETLYATTTQASDGTIPQISFADAVARLGHADLVKLDCEGAEWDLFKDPETWTKVRSLVMEYHLWAKPGATVETLKQALSSLGFKSVAFIPDPDGSWGFAYASRSGLS